MRAGSEGAPASLSNCCRLSCPISRKGKSVDVNDRGIAACERVREMTDTVLLGFSGGKDSVCTWLRLREYFPRVIPIFHYYLPGLEFVEAALRYYEGFFDQRIIRLPHPGLMDMLRYGAFQGPGRYQVCEWWNYARANFREQADWIAEDHGIAQEDAWMAVGLRSADSVLRRVMFQAHGVVNPNQRKFYPLADHKKADLIAMLDVSGIRLAPDYAIIPRSFDGVAVEYLRPIREHYPRDFARILEWFPLVEAEFYREEIYLEQKEQRAARSV